MADIYDFCTPFLRYFRSRRLKRFAQDFAITDQTSIIDLRGTPFNWAFLEEKPLVTNRMTGGVP